MDFENNKFRINNNLTSEKNLSISDKKNLIGKTVIVDSISKGGLYSCNYKGRFFSLRKRTLSPVVSKKEFNQFKGLFLKFINEGTVLISLHEGLKFALDWYNFLTPVKNGFVFSKKAKKIDLKGIEEVLFPKINAYSSNKKNNEKIKSNEIKSMLSIAEKYGFDCIERNNYDYWH